MASNFSPAARKKEVITVVVQFYPWFKFYFLLFLGIVKYDNEFETKEKKIWTKDKIEPQHHQVKKCLIVKQILLVSTLGNL